MHILIAPDSFKGSLSAVEASGSIGDGVHAAMPEASIDLCPIADGGEGTVEAMILAASGDPRKDNVSGLLGEPIAATWGMLGDKKTAVIEMAAAAGLGLMTKDDCDPMKTTTYGVGELILRAIDAGAKKIIIGVGGSGTNDCGCGMAQALGVKFYKSNGEECERGLAGGGLMDIAKIDVSGVDARVGKTEIVVACDVTNPLTGVDGASAVYGPQKGATEKQVRELDEALGHVSRLMSGSDPMAAGAGAAGGLGFGLVVFAGAKLGAGIEMILDAVRFDRRVKLADLVLTGEGKLDGQSVNGKACVGVAKRAAAHDVDTIALVGCASDDAGVTLEHGLKAYYPICDGDISVETSIKNAGALLQLLTEKVLKGF